MAHNIATGSLRWTVHGALGDQLGIQLRGDHSLQSRPRNFPLISDSILQLLSNHNIQFYSTGRRHFSPGLRLVAYAARGAVFGDSPRCAS